MEKRFYFNPEKEYTIINTIDGYDSNDENWINEFKMWCEDEGYEFDAERNVALQNGDVISDCYGWVRACEETDCDEFIHNLRMMKKYDCPCIVTGHFDSVYPDFYGSNPARVLAVNPIDNLSDAIFKCTNNRDYIKVTVKDNVIYVTACHHDGTDYYEIRLCAKSAYPTIKNGRKTDEEILANKKNFIRPYWNLFGMA